VPLYLFALWRCLDRASPAAVVLLGGATVAVTLSNFYGGLIAAVITPVALAAYWLVRRPTDTQSSHRLGVTLAGVLIFAASGMAFASLAASDVVGNRTAFASTPADLFRYSAKWWSYLVPPVAHPLLGEAAQRIWTAADVRVGLLEQQVSLGWAVVALGLVAIFRWMVPVGRVRQPAPLVYVPVLVVVAVAALVCSLSPERTIGTFTFVRPSAIVYFLAPMFRSYARFGVVVQLMAALLAGIGVDQLRRAGTRRALIACLALVALAAGEYAVWPPALWRDVLPTDAHRWIMRQPERLRVLDCVPLTQESASVQWLTRERVSPLTDTVDDCLEPDLPRKLAAVGYTHLLVRPDGADGQWRAAHSPREGLRAAADFDDGLVLAVTARTSPVYTARVTGFFPRERDAARTWRWMGTDAAWTMVNTGTEPIAATLGVELSAFHHARQMEVRLDGRHVHTFVIFPVRRIYQIGPLTVSAGDHELAFRPVEAPAVAAEVIDNGDPRALSFEFGAWSWTVAGELP
jgi:hypothetical protein